MILILAGPTACGKTELAIALAQRFGAEIIGADSRQIYRGMPIGTAAPTPEQQERSPHHLVGFFDPYERYSAARFVDDALDAIAAISARGRRVIVVGGTGFYLRALCGEVELCPRYDPVLRARLAREATLHPPEILHAWLAARDPQRARAVAATDRYRIVRALEITLAAPCASGIQTHPSLRSRGYEAVKVRLEIDPQQLDARIEHRVDAMLAAGFIEEAERIGSQAVASNAVGYAEVFAYLQGWSTYAQLRGLLVRATRRYAKRQRTWFRSEPHMLGIEVGEAFTGLERLARERLGWT